MPRPTPPPRSPFVRQLLAAAFALGLPLAVRAQSREPRPFDIPAGDAVVTLRTAAKSGGVQVMFVADTVLGVRTQPVRGSFSTGEALDRMLAGTGLVVVWDARAQAFSVGTAPLKPGASPEPRPRAASDSASPETSSAQTSIMKDTTRRSILAALLGLAATGTVADAQTTSASATASEAVVLSPFTVTTEQDTGYAATNTLAGTRLNTPVKDLGSSLSIYTKDFLNDIGATNANELLVYATGMEAAGAQGNFSGSGNDINADRIVGESSRARPQGATRTRGLAAPNFTRGFFPTEIPFDSYNSDTVTVNRGPNSILFGVGSPAGVIDGSPVRPSLNRNTNKLDTRFGNNASARVSLDLSRVLIPGKLAARVVALEDREEFNQRPAFEHKRRLYGAVTYEPTRSTSLRTNFEAGRTRANRPITVLPFNSVSPQWIAAGQPVFDWSFYDDPARNPAAAAQNAGNFIPPTMGFEQRSDQVAVIYAQPNSRAPDAAFRVVLPGGTTNAANTLRNTVFHPLVNRDSAADGINAVSTRNIGELTGVSWPGGQVPAGIKWQGFTDYSAFDFQDRLIDESSRQGDSFRAFNIAIEQRAWRDRIGIELAYDTQRYDTRAKNSFFSAQQVNNIRVETTATLPDGTRNPNLGRPFIIFGQANWSNNYSERAAWRVTPYLRYDFKDVSPRLGRWLGRHTLTGLYERNTVDSISYSHRLATAGPLADAISPNVEVFSRRPGLVVFLGDSVLGGKPLRLEPIRIPELTGGISFPATYFSAPAGSPAQGTITTATTSLVEINNGGNASREVIKSQAAVLQSYWLADHLVTMVGWRRDEDYFARQNIAFVPNLANPSDPGKVHYGFNDFSFARTPPPNAAKEITSYSAVLRWPNKLLRLPLGSELSGFVNVSENFTPTGGRVNAYNVPLASPEGETREFGFNFSTFSGKLSLRVNRFETKVVGQGGSTQAFGQATNNAVVQLASFWAVERNTNPHIDRSADIALLFSPLPANYAELNQYRVTGSAAQQNLAAAFTGLPGRSDTTDFTARGIEFEAVYNPTRNWRILANVARQESIQTNAYPGLKEFIGRMLPVWTQLGDRPRGNYPTGHVIGTPLPAGTETLMSWLRTNVLTPYATALATEGTVTAEQRKWRVNVVANYTFARASRLHGWSAGTGARWQDKIGIGYPASRAPDGSLVIDRANPYFSDPLLNIDSWIGYKRKIFSDRIEWRAQLNVRNVLGDDDPVPITVQPWGEVATTRLPPERRFYLTNTFSF
jgi:hypothetical protein